MFDQRKLIIGPTIIACLLLMFGFFIYDLSPVNASASTSSMVFEVKQGEGFRTIIDSLYNQGLIRSRFAVEAISVIDGTAFEIQPGLYQVNSSMSSMEIMRTISGAKTEITVTIPEGSTMYDIDRILSANLIIHSGQLIAVASSSMLEGKLFPDTYDFYTGSNVNDVIQKFVTNFNVKAEPLLAVDQANSESNLIIASILEKEVTSSTDQSIVAGILEKRLADGIPLDIDATICYIKEQEHPTSTAGCYPLTPADFQINSPYNTYLYRGLPPGPIGNPGISAIEAALHPQSSPYLYYLSDPKTGETIYAKTLAQQDANRTKYLSP